MRVWRHSPVSRYSFTVVVRKNLTDKRPALLRMKTSLCTRIRFRDIDFIIFLNVRVVINVYISHDIHCADRVYIRTWPGARRTAMHNRWPLALTACVSRASAFIARVDFGETFARRNSSADTGWLDDNRCRSHVRSERFPSISNAPRLRRASP